MATLTGNPDGFSSEVRRLEVTDPVHADTFNSVNQRLIDNDTSLDTRVASALRSVGVLQGSSAAITGRAFRLDKLYSGDKTAFEFFADGWTLQDIAPIAVQETVIGDDTIDLASTDGLTAGGHYVIYDGEDIELVVIDTILSSTRVRATAELAHQFGPAARLARSNWVQEAFQATTTAGSVYYSDVIDLGVGSQSAPHAIVLRRADDDTILTVAWQNEGQATWQEVAWAWKREIDDQDGIVDYEYFIPSDGPFCLRIQAQGTTAVEHIIALSQETDLGGTHHPPVTPAAAHPADEATDVQDEPTLTLSDYSSPVGTAQAHAQFQISTSTDFTAILHDSGMIGAGLGYSIPQNVLEVSTTYYWRARIIDALGGASEWSSTFSFTTAANFKYIVTPSILSPAEGAEGIRATPTLLSSAFSAFNVPDTSLRSEAGQWTASSEGTGEFYWTGAALAGKPASITANGTKLIEGELGNLSEDTWGWGKSDDQAVNTVYVRISQGDPDAQASDFIMAGPLHISSRWQVRTADGSYDAARYDSQEDTESLTSITLPKGVLSDGRVRFFARVQHTGVIDGANQASQWSAEICFETRDLFATVVGLVLTQAGSGGQWQRINGDFAAISAEPGGILFNAHPVWGGIEKETLDGQAMVKIPKFYYRTGIVTEDESPTHAGKRFWAVADAPVTGFTLHPAFLSIGGEELDYFHIASYMAAKAVTKAVSKIGTTFSALPDSAATARNVNGESGWEFMTIYEWTAIQWLVFIEAGQSDVQATYGSGSDQNYPESAGEVFVPPPSVAGSSAHVKWRGVEAIWGIACEIPGLVAVNDLINTSNYLTVWNKNGSRDPVATTELFACWMQNIGTVTSDPIADYTFLADTTLFRDQAERLGINGTPATASIQDSSFPDAFHQDGRGSTFAVGISGSTSNNNSVGGVGLFAAGARGRSYSSIFRRLIKRPAGPTTEE